MVDEPFERQADLDKAHNRYNEIIAELSKTDEQYGGEETQYQDKYEDDNNNLPTSPREWGAFYSDLAEKTIGIKIGGIRKVIVTTSENIYLVEATGFKEYKSILKYSIDDEYIDTVKKVREEFLSDQESNIHGLPDKGIKGNRSFSRGSNSSHVGDEYRGEEGKNVALDKGKLETDSPAGIVENYGYRTWKDFKESLNSGDISINDDSDSDSNAQYQDRYSPDDSYYMELAKDPEKNHDALVKMVEEAAREKGFFNAIPEQTLAYKTRTGKPPRRTVKVYKTFTMSKNGKPSALFVSGVDELPIGVWLDAQDTWHFTANNGKEYVPSTKNPNTQGGKTGASVQIPNEEVRQELIKRGFVTEKAKNVTALAYRPGWHAGDLPFFPQGGKGGNSRLTNSGNANKEFDPSIPENNSKPYNIATTLFDLNNKDYQNELLRDGNIKYRKKQKSVEELLSQRRQLPKAMAQHAFGNIIFRDGQKVNNIFPEEEKEQHQDRTTTLSDNDVLSMAAETIDKEGFTQEEKNALDIVKKTLSELDGLIDQRIEQGRIYKEQQFGKPADRVAAEQTRNRMKNLEDMIRRKEDEILSIKEKNVIKGILKKSRKIAYRAPLQMIASR